MNARTAVAAASLLVAAAAPARAGEPTPAPPASQLPPTDVDDPRLAAAVPTTACPGGRAISDETDGHCCWPGQVWAKSRAACVGIPECPAGLAPVGESCVGPDPCPKGQRITDDTDGHCCFPGQAWSRRRAACVGIPQCEEGQVAVGERCQPAPASAPPAGAATASSRAGRAVATAEPSHLGMVPVFFEANLERNQYHVAIGAKGCETPCKLYLHPGTVQLTIEGDGSFSKELSIPEHPSVMRIQHAANGEAIAGGVMMGVGTAMMLSNLAILGEGGSSGFGAVVAFGMVLGPITHLAGIITFGVGLSRLSGANRLIPFGGDVSRARPPSGLRLVDVGLAPVAGGGAGAGVRFAF
jgi:hypothetical protein